MNIVLLPGYVRAQAPFGAQQNQIVTPYSHLGADGQLQPNASGNFSQQLMRQHQFGPSEGYTRFNQAMLMADPTTQLQPLEEGPRPNG